MKTIIREHYTRYLKALSPYASASPRITPGDLVERDRPDLYEDGYSIGIVIGIRVDRFDTQGNTSAISIATVLWC